MWDSQSSRGDRRVCAPTYPRPLTRVTFMQGRSGCCCVGWEGWARTNDNAVHSRALYRLSYSPMFCFSAGSRYCFGMGSERVAEDMKRTKKSRETPDPHQVFNHGLRFLTTDQAVRRIFGGDPNWSPVIAPPTMVLSAFASELLLKCLLIIETGEAPDNIHEFTLSLESSNIRQSDTSKKSGMQNVAARLRASPSYRASCCARSGPTGHALS